MPQPPTRLAEILKANGVESQLELLLLNRLIAAGLPVGEPGQQIIPGRKFEFDRVWREPYRICVEVQGATFVKGGHSSGRGIERDCEKACLAAIHGWRYLPVTKHMIEDGRAVSLIAAALGLARAK